MNGMFPAMFILMNEARERRARIATALLPAMVPVAASQRVAVAAIAADQQIRDAETREQRVASDVVSAIEVVAARPSGGNQQLTETELATTMPTLSTVVRRQRDLLTRINGVALMANQRIEAGVQQVATEVISAIEVAAAAPNNQLTNTDLNNRPRLAALVNSDPALRGRIDTVALAADATNLATEVISAIEVAAAAPNNQLSDAELANRPRLAALVNSDPAQALRLEIDRIAGLLP